VNRTHKQPPALVELVRYPLKSGAGEALQQAHVSARGVHDDRRWMVVDEHGTFLTARRRGQLLGVSAEPGPEGAITLRASGRPSCRVAAPDPVLARRSVEVWEAACDGLDLGDDAAQWMTAIVGEKCRVVYMPDSCQRSINSSAAQTGDIVSFADGFPLLLTLKESLDRLNNSIQSRVSMRCFRPNVVVTGFAPFSELSWSRVRIGTIDFEVGGPCVRCQLITRHPETGVRRSDGQPLTHLAKTQRTEQGVVFGINLIPRGTGTLRLGDPVLPLPST
jgi:uncharacterized protein